jgi:hypothetical protein
MSNQSGLFFFQRMMICWQWIEEVEEPVLDHDEVIGNMVQDLIRERP